MASRTLSAGFRWRRPGARFYPRISLGESLLALVHLLLLWQERTNERLRLREMDDHLLKDIGITRVDALREGEKPFWRT